MPPSPLYVALLIAGMIFTGSGNSLWSKFQDLQCVEHCDDPDPTAHVLYEQPVWQTLQMFLGEMLCFLPVLLAAARSRQSSTPVHLAQDDQDEASSKLQTLRGWGYLLLWAPAICDLTGTTLMNVGLLYTPVSIYQMTRGSLVLFVGVLSVIFLRRHLRLYQWMSLVTVMFGVSLVGYSGSFTKEAVKDNFITLRDPGSAGTPEATKVLIGVFFVLFAQIFTASQFVIEEKIMGRYSVAPLVAVGWEGFFGTITILICMPMLSRWASFSAFFDLPRGWHQMVDNPAVLWSGVIVAISIAFFNFFGLSVTRHVSANARSLIDTCRTLSIWLVSLALGWERFVWPISLLQVAGFGLLVYGTLLFNNLVAPLPFFKSNMVYAPNNAIPTEEAQALLDEARAEEQASPSEDILQETSALPADLGQSGYDVLPERPTR